MAAALPDIEPLAAAPGRRMEQAIAAVRAAIDDGRMRPGVRYSVYQLAEALGVSRTPVREALLRLEEVGLIKFEARQGFRILQPRATDIAGIFAVRLALEVPAARRAAGTGGELARALRRQQRLMRAAARHGDDTAFARHDQGLHDLIMAGAGNERARTIVRRLRETTRLLGAATADKTRTLADIDAEHAPIVAAIAAGDGERAAAAMRSHLVNTGKLLVEQALQAEGAEAGPAAVDALWTGSVY